MRDRVRACSKVRYSCPVFYVKDAIELLSHIVVHRKARRANSSSIQLSILYKYNTGEPASQRRFGFYSTAPPGHYCNDTTDLNAPVAA